MRFTSAGVSAVAEQALSSVAILLVHVAVARATTVDAYGGFAMVFAVYVLIELTHRALFGEAAMVFLVRYRRPRAPGYARLVLAGHLLITFAASVALVALALVLGWAGEAALRTATLGLAAALVPLLSGSLLRRLCYAYMRPGIAALGGGLNLLAVLVGVVLLSRTALLTPFSAFLVMAAGACVLTLGAGFWLRLPLRPHRPSPTWRRVLREHWVFGRSAVPAAILAWIPVHVYYLVLPILDDVGRDASGQLRAALTLVMPLIQVNAALGTLLVAVFSSRVASKARSGAGSYALTLMAASFAYWVLLVAVGRDLMVFVFGTQFASTASILPILGALPVLTAPAHVLRSLGLARNRPDIVLRSQAAAAAVTLTAGLLLARRWLLGGSAGGMLLAVAAQIAVLAWFLVLRRTRSHPNLNHHAT